jgi:hypothetical protein
MKKIGINLKLLVIILSVVFMGTSCSDNLEGEYQLKGDVFIKAYKQADTVVYNRLYYAYSNYEMENVTVTDSDNAINIELDTISYKYTYAHIPARDTYTTERPESGNYLFDVEFEDGTTELAEDYLEPGYVVPVDFTTLGWDTASNKLIIEWDKVDNADYYGLVLKNENEEIIYESGIINNIYNRISLNNYTTGWKDGLLPESGDSLKVIHTTYRFEYQISTYDLQCLAVNDVNTVAWGGF